MRLLLCWMVLFSFAIPAYAQRLPETAVPVKYALTFQPELNSGKFYGRAVIDIKINHPTEKLIVNAVDLSFDQVVVRSLADGTEARAAVTLDAEAEMATFTLPHKIPAGEARITATYTGVLNDQLRGFYLNRANNRRYASTQFEPTDARRAFPCWDEPAYKATFDITLIADNGDTAISNGRIIKDVPGPDAGKHTISFSQTAKMSAYLVAMAVGDFKCVEGIQDAIPIRICATPDKYKLGKYALESARSILKFYNGYYTIRYPFEKLDIVAVPDFEAGAMENTAAIFYRETRLLIPDNATAESRRRVATVLAHEMAHMWFGDLVTMQWWDDIWLNEGFATWMTYKAVAVTNPEWDMESDAVLSAITAMSTDSLLSTRPIRQNATTSAQINELFDSIAYNKTAAVLRMVEGYVGPEVFRNGINKYIENHAYKNATAEDFWNTIAGVSGKPVDRIMKSFVDQPGLPLVAASCNKPSSEMNVRQRRYTFDRKAFQNEFSETWQIPVCFHAIKDANAEMECEAISKANQPVRSSGCADLILQNADSRGFYRSAYDAASLQKMIPRLQKSLSQQERLLLIEDVWSLLRVDLLNIDQFLDLAAAHNGERNRAVMKNLTEHLTFIADYLATEADEPAYRAWLVRFLLPMANELGWEARSSEEDERRMLRASVIYTLGYAARDPQTLKRAESEIPKIIDGSSSLDKEMVDVAVKLAAIEGNAALHDRYLAEMRKTNVPEDYYRFFYGLTYFTDPSMIEKSLRFLLSPDMRNQDAPGFVKALLTNPAAAPLTWDFVKQNWEELQHHLTVWGGAEVVAAAGQFCKSNAAEEIQNFFASHRVLASERTLKQTLEKVNECVDLKSQQATKLSEWLKRKGA